MVVASKKLAISQDIHKVKVVESRLACATVYDVTDNRDYRIECYDS